MCGGVSSSCLAVDGGQDPYSGESEAHKALEVADDDLWPLQH